MSRLPLLLAFAALPLVACMDAGAATGTDDATIDTLPSQHRGAAATGAAGPATTSSEPRGPGAIYDPGLGRKILSVGVTCAGQTAFLQVQTAEAADELELRMAPELKAGEYHRVYQVRQSYLLEPLLRAPTATTYPSMAMVPLGAETCDDFKAQIEEVRGRFSSGYESFDLRPPAAP